jgi:hypothetical protein
MAGWIMNEVKSELTRSQDFIFIGVRFCTLVGLMSHHPDRIVKIMSRVGQLSTLKFCQAREFLSHWPTKLSDRSDPTREVVSPTSSTSPILQMETTSGSPGSGNSGTQRISSIRECCYKHPLPNFPCSQTRRFNHEGCVVMKNRADLILPFGIRWSVSCQYQCQHVITVISNGQDE